MANASPIPTLWIQGGSWLFLKAWKICASLNLFSVGEFGLKLVVLEYCWPRRRILASLSFPRSGSGFREAAVVGGPAACPPAPAHPPLTAALRFALAPLPPHAQNVRKGLSLGPGSRSSGGCPCARSSAGGCSLTRACPLPRAGRPHGATTSHSSCGPGAPSLGTPGQGGSLSPKVWAQATLASGNWRAGPGFLFWTRGVWIELFLTGASTGGPDPRG